jgi:hypothetical protein
LNNSWSIGLSYWILADGNYAGFEVSQIRQFALEFYPKDLSHSGSFERVAELLDRCTYRVNGIVEYVDKNMCVLNFGVRAYCEVDRLPQFWTEVRGSGEIPSTLTAGQALKGTIRLGVDPFFYMEQFCREPNVIPLIYTWHVNAIHGQAGSRVWQEGEGWVVDEDKAQWHPLNSTFDRFKQSTGQYEFTCTLVEEVPPTADGEPLATWDRPQIERDMRSMEMAELKGILKFYDLAISKLELLVETSKNNSVELQADLNPAHDVFRELGLDETKHNLSLHQYWMEDDDCTPESYLTYIKGLRDKALEHISLLENGS